MTFLLQKVGHIDSKDLTEEKLIELIEGGNTITDIYPQLVTQKIRDLCKQKNAILLGDGSVAYSILQSQKVIKQIFGIGFLCGLITAGTAFLIFKKK